MNPTAAGQGAQGAPTGKNLMQTLRETSAVQLAELPVLQQRFVALLQKTRGADQNMAQMIFEQERYHFMRQISNSPQLKECETLSLYGCFMDCAVNGLSFDPSKKLAYIIPGNVNIGSKDHPIWTKRATLEATPYGELAIRIQNQQIKYADNPVVVYEGDTFEPSVENGVTTVNYKLNVNHGTKIIAAFIRLVRIDGTLEYKWLLESDWKRLEAYSAKKNRGKANELYSSYNGNIDPGFLCAKVLKHAFKSMPKVTPLGNHTQIAADPDELTPTTDLTKEDIYGFKPDGANQIEPGAQNLQLGDGGAGGAPTTIPNQAPAPTPELSDQAKAAILNATAEGEPQSETRNFNIPEDDDNF